MGRSVSYASGAQVVTFRSFSFESQCGQCEGTGTTDAMGEEEECPVCDGTGYIESDDDFDMLIDDFRDTLRSMFPSVVEADEWLGREDHVLAENRLAYFGMSEYCGLVSYWIVPKEADGYSDTLYVENFAKRWIDSISDKFVAAFGELTKVGSMSNGEGVYRRIDR